jgi:hypothetical protein
MKCCVIVTMLIGATCTSVVPNNNNVRRRELQQLDGCINPPNISPVQIVSEHSGLVLKVNADDGSVVQSFASSSISDNWVFVNAGGGLFRLINQGTNGAMSGKCAIVRSDLFCAPSVVKRFVVLLLTSTAHDGFGS